MAETILKLDKLSKDFRSHWTFRRIPALKEISLEVYQGESFGFLGHNGAGKTTAIKCILGLIKKSSGSIQLDGKELTSAAQHRELGYLPELPYFYDHLTVEETLDFFAALFSIPKHERRLVVPETLELVGLAARMKSPVRALSKGLQQRLAFAQAIVNRPRLLLLDEPFSGFDPLGRLEFRKLILELKRQGTTIFMSSHILSDVEDICDRVSIMVRGEIKRVFDLREKQQLFGEAYEVSLRVDEAKPELIQELLRHAKTHRVEHLAQGEHVVLLFEDYNTAQACVATALTAGARLEAFNSSSLSLEEIFMNITRGNNGTISPGGH